MKQIFIHASKFAEFKKSHHIYDYKEVYSIFGDLIGYNVSVVENNKD